MFGQNRRRRFEKAVTEEVAYLLGLHGAPAEAFQAAVERARRPNIPGSRVRVIEAAAQRLKALADQATPGARQSPQTILASVLPQ
ncbi:MAG: hypothetical protein GC145_06780 [Caulobacter sp.]|nr:hypothetical protein [Caulobacter sp.]